MHTLKPGKYLSEHQVIENTCKLTHDEIIYLKHIIDQFVSQKDVLQARDFFEKISTAFMLHMNLYIEQSDQLEPELAIRGYVLYQAIRSVCQDKKNKCMVDSIPYIEKKLLDDSLHKTGVLCCTDFDAVNFHAVSSAVNDAYQEECDKSLSI